jgi:hypothetical protein
MPDSRSEPPAPWLATVPKHPMSVTYHAVGTPGSAPHLSEPQIRLRDLQLNRVDVLSIPSLKSEPKSSVASDRITKSVSLSIIGSLDPRLSTYIEGEDRTSADTHNARFLTRQQEDPQVTHWKLVAFNKTGFGFGRSLQTALWLSTGSWHSPRLILIHRRNRLWFRDLRLNCVT